MHRQLLIGGEWKPSAEPGLRPLTVTSPYDGRVVGEVVAAGTEDVGLSIEAAERGAARWRRTPAHERAAILNRAAQLADERAEEIAAVLSAENGKTLKEARSEAGRSGDIIRLAAFEGTQLYGQTLPLDANPGTGQDKLGFTLRQPAGIVAAITPFNYPALLVMHKVAPALAAGNAVILKPASTTPLTALALAECFIDAGLPEGVLSVLPGPGSTVGDALVSDPAVRKVSFTGSTAVGEHLASIAGVKKLSLELGASSPVVVLPDADLELAASAVAAGGYVNAGQVCISVQRVIAHRSIAGDFNDALLAKVREHRTGDPGSADTTVGTLITEKEARRVEAAIQGAANAGARLETGGQRDGAIVEPALLTGVAPDAEIIHEELFGPAVAVSTAEDITEAIALANSTSYGLAAGIFTKDVNAAVQAAREVDAGSIHINWTPLWRADLMPYGGLKASGVGKEGPRAAVEEMTEAKTIVLHGQPWT
ncbi:aldehyde dehydrogenase family protein [Kocuria coralli]|uniref:Aldehyde dehydrogenase family protein n=1 Tax=Kocuria coralli TaxID=1461025 RepID=A0A5J5KXB5_9MICC|nr:aldehyde dehydrogenase family protein [Kocuria coralli]KAA9394294.1 aldehyde dehydrogenase family protein [Kocuria coralli]